MTQVLIEQSASEDDLDAIWKFLSTQAYWGRWRTREDVMDQVRKAWQIAVAKAPDTHELIGFARATSDGTAIAYLSDVFVLPAARGHGVGARLVASLLEHPQAARFKWMLHTDDAHRFYERFGFSHPADGRFMERDRLQPTTSSSRPHVPEDL